MKPAIRSPNLQGWLFRCGAVVLGIAMALSLAEVAVRVRLGWRPNDIEALRRFEEARRRGGALRLIDFVRPSRERGLIYELIPGSYGRFKDAPVRINQAGFFDRERSVIKPPASFRIATLGDSLLFGWGVPIERRYSTLLEDFLNRTAGSGHRFEVLNFAVPGYNTVMEAELLRARVLAYEPDLLLLAFCHDNDAALPNFVAKPRPLWTVQHSYLFELLSNLGSSEAIAALESGLQDGDPAQVPAEYQHLVGWDRAEAALASIHRIMSQRQVQVYLLTDYYWLEAWPGGRSRLAKPGELAQFYDRVEKIGYQTVNPAQEMVAFLGRHQLQSRALWLSERDVHPNTIRHALTAKALYRRLVEGNELPDAISRRARLEQDLVDWDREIENLREQLQRTGVLGEARQPPAPEQAAWNRRFVLTPDGQIECLGMGWCAPESNGSWICDRPAVLHFHLRDAADLNVTLTGWALPARDKGPQEVEAALNGYRQPAQRLGPTAREQISFRFPAEAARRGLNRLALSCAWLDRPARLRMNQDSRLLGMQVIEVEFSTQVAPPLS